MISGLRATVGDQITSEQAWTLARLEAILNDTPGLLLRRKPPANEPEFQHIMHDCLSACFLGDFVHNPPIGGFVKNFVPDCGIRSVDAAIEFKLAHTKNKAVRNFTGVVEDTGGYKGSKDWTLFYAVMCCQDQCGGS